ncbi:MAG: hypothetical protein Q9O62_06415 [Ardenticatenia bacterium]|nr:hypothetical protein [Ardenticatenia bacterium]
MDKVIFPFQALPPQVKKEKPNVLSSLYIKTMREFISRMRFFQGKYGITPVLVFNKDKGIEGYLRISSRDGRGALIPTIPYSKLEITPYNTLEGRTLVNPIAEGKKRVPVKLIVMRNQEALEDIFFSILNSERGAAQVFHATDPRTGEVSNVAVLLTGVDKEAEQRLGQNEWNMLKTAFENVYSSPEYGLLTGLVNQAFGVGQNINLAYVSSDVYPEAAALQYPGTFVFAESAEEGSSLVHINLFKIAPEAYD